MQNFFRELKYRKVIKIGIAYVVGAFVVMESADIVFPAIGLPETAITLVIGLLAVGFPLALIRTWVFDLPPDVRVKRVACNVPVVYYQHIGFVPHLRYTPSWIIHHAERSPRAHLHDTGSEALLLAETHHAVVRQNLRPPLNIRHDLEADVPRCRHQ